MDFPEKASLFEGALSGPHREYNENLKKLTKSEKSS
jgi:hypothetical protein